MLTDMQIKKARYTPPGDNNASDGSNKLNDGGGLFNRLKPNGSKLWQFRYRFPRMDPKTGQVRYYENTLSFGAYPAVPLASRTENGIKFTGARELAEKARSLIAQGIDPATVREQFTNDGTSPDTFESVAREWLLKRTQQLAPGYLRTIVGRLENDVYPYFGARRISDITPPEVLRALRLVEARGARESAHRTRSICGQVFRYGVATGRVERDPTRDLVGALEHPTKKHYATLTKPHEVAGLLRAIDQYEGEHQTRIALRILILTFVRPGNLRHAEWSELHSLDTPDRAEWRIPGRKMKVRTNHDFVVPLSRQSISLLEELRQFTGRGKYLFPSPRSKTRAMSNNTINGALRRMGFSKTEMTGHGARAMARTIAHETLHFDPNVIEEQLAHGKSGPLRDSYDKTEHLVERRRLMQAWADWLDGLNPQV